MYSEKNVPTPYSWRSGTLSPVRRPYAPPYASHTPLFPSLSERSEAKFAFSIRFMRFIRLFSTPEHFFTRDHITSEDGEFNCSEKLNGSTARSTKRVFDPAREDLGKRAKSRACGLVDALGTAIIKKVQKKQSGYIFSPNAPSQCPLLL